MGAVGRVKLAVRVEKKKTGVTKHSAEISMDPRSPPPLGGPRG